MDGVDAGRHRPAGPAPGMTDADRLREARARLGAQQLSFRGKAVDDITDREELLLCIYLLSEMVEPERRWIRTDV